MEFQRQEQFSQIDVSPHWGSYESACAESVRHIVSNNHRPILIAGNGPSLSAIDYTRLPKDVFIWRVNNFYFEEKYWLGKEVDALYMGGHPRVIQSFTNTLMTVLTRREYGVKTFVGRTDNLFKINSHYFPILDVRKAFITNRDISNFMTLAHMPPGILPTSGILSIFAAIAFGYKEIYLAGIDLYAGANRYAYPIGANHAKIVGIPSGATGYFEAFHGQDADLRGLNFALSMPGVSISTVCPSSPIGERVGLAPVIGEAWYTPEDKPEGYIRDFVPIPKVPSKAPPKPKPKPAQPRKKQSAKMRFLNMLERNLPGVVVKPGEKVLRALGIL